MKRFSWLKSKSVGDRHALQVVGLIAAVVALFVAAVWLGIWRFGDSHASSKLAIEEGQTQLLAQQVKGNINQEVGLVDAYGGDKDPADLEQLDTVKAELAAVLPKLRTSPERSPEELAEVDALESDQERLNQIFADQVAPVAGTEKFDQGVKPFTAEACLLYTSPSPRDS